MKIMLKILIYVFAYTTTRLIAGVHEDKIKKIDIFFTEIELQQRVFLIKIKNSKVFLCCKITFIKSTDYNSLYS